MQKATWSKPQAGKLDDNVLQIFTMLPIAADLIHLGQLGIGSCLMNTAKPKGHAVERANLVQLSLEDLVLQHEIHIKKGHIPCRRQVGFHRTKSVGHRGRISTVVRRSWASSICVPSLTSAAA